MVPGVNPWHIETMQSCRQNLSHFYNIWGAGDKGGNAALIKMIKMSKSQSSLSGAQGGWSKLLSWQDPKPHHLHLQRSARAEGAQTFPGTGQRVQHAIELCPKIYIYIYMDILWYTVWIYYGSHNYGDSEKIMDWTILWIYEIDDMDIHRIINVCLNSHL